MNNSLTPLEILEHKRRLAKCETIDAYRQWFSDSRAQYFDTINPENGNRRYKVSLEFLARQRRFLKHFYARLDRKLCGRASFTFRNRSYLHPKASAFYRE